MLHFVLITEHCRCKVRCNIIVVSFLDNESLFQVAADLLHRLKKYKDLVSKYFMYVCLLFNVKIKMPKQTIFALLLKVYLQTSSDKSFCNP